MCKRKGIVKRLLCLLIAFIITLSLSANKAYAVAVPMLPYIPPSDANIMDIIFNAFGVTAPDIAEAEKKAEGYWQLYRIALGGAYESFRDKLEDAIDKSKTSRELVLDDDLISKLQIGQVYAIDNGILVENDSAEVTPAVVRSWFQTNGIQINDSAVNTIVNDYSNIQTGQRAIIGKDSSNYGYYVRGDIVGQNGKPNVVNAVYGGYISEGYFYGYNMSGYFNYLTNWAFLDDVARYTNKSVAVQNAVIMQALRAGHVKPITANTQVENGTIVDGSPVVIKLPTVLPFPADTVTELPTVQEQLGVVPVTDDLADMVEQLKQAVTEKYGSASDYAIDLTQYFPFCLPFDVFRIIGALIAEPEAPKFSYTIVNPWRNDAEHNITLEIDLVMFDRVAEVLRTLECILFVVGLCVVTRSLYLRG